MAHPAVTLLFAHANGFCKEAWTPVIRRMTQSPLLQRAPVEIVTYDQPYQGENRDESELGEVFFKDDDPARPRVKHPMNDWVAKSTGAAYDQARRLKEQGRPLIGIGHSMGAAALWATEATHPGTFDGLILFEPIYGKVDAPYDRSVDFLVSITLQREKKWPSIQAAESHFANWKNFASWNRESLTCWLKGGVVFDKAQQAAVLACHPHVEASVYSGGRLTLSARELAAPKCRIAFHSGIRTRLFDREVFQKLQQRFPDIYKMHAPMEDTSHLMVFEDPESTANAVLADLQQLAPFQASKL